MNLLQEMDMTEGLAENDCDTKIRYPFFSSFFLLQEMDMTEKDMAQV